MKAVLRVALTCFAMFPVQRWINVAALVLIFLAAVIFVVGDSMNAATGIAVLCTLGAVLLLISPAFAGALAFRQASADVRLHLLPHGRQRVLLGTTLALTLFGAIAALPAFAAEMFRATHDFAWTGRPPPSVLACFQLGWAIMAMLWICLFALSRTPVAMFMFALVPVLVIKLEEFVSELFPGITAGDVFAVGVGAWILFALWYLSARRIDKPAALPSFGAPPAGEQSGLPFFVKIDDAGAGADSRATAVLQYLFGSSSYRMFALNGIWIAAILLLAGLFGGGQRATGPGQFLYMLPFLTMLAVSIGFTTARRARLLWLRAGMDRAGLFALAARRGLRGALTTWGVVAGSLGLLAMADNPARAPAILLFLASQAAVTACLFYGGLAFVRDWSVRDVLLGIGLVFVFLLQVSVLGPNQVGNVVLPWTTLLVLAVVLAIVLRWYALRQWRTVDWRVIRIAKLDWRRG